MKKDNSPKKVEQSDFMKRRLSFFETNQQKKNEQLPRKSVQIDKTKMKERLAKMKTDYEKDKTFRRRKTECFKVENFNTNNVERMNQTIKDKKLDEKKRKK